MKLGSLVVEIGADTAGFVRGADETKTRLTDLGTRARGTVNSFGKIAAGAAAAGAALAATIVVQSASAAKELKNLSDIAGTTPESFQKMAFAARSVGVEQQKLSDILKDTQDRIGDFLQTGGGPMADFFERIAPQVGVTADQFRNLSGPQALQLYVDSLDKANLSQADMTFYMEAMASDATALIPILRDGGAALKEQAQRAEDLGLVLSDLDTERLAQLSGQLKLGSEAIGSLTAQFSAELAPTISAVIRLLEEAAVEAGGFGEVGSSAAGFVTKSIGFVLDAADGVNRVFQVAGRSIAVFGLGATDVMLTLARDIVEFPTAATNELISLLNKLPKIDIDTIGMSKLGRKIQDELDVVKRASEIGIQDIQDILMEEMPSVALGRMVDEAKAEMDRAAEAVLAAKEKARSDGGSGVETFQEQQAREGEEDENAALRAKLAEKLEIIRQANLSELEALREKQEMESAVIAEGRARDVELRGEWDEIERETKARHEQEMTALEKRNAEQRRMLAERELQARQATTGQILGNISTLMNTESRKMFEIGKMAGIANSVISTYTGASKALELGWPLGPIAAASIAATGFAQVSAIQSQSFGGGANKGGAGSNTANVNAAAEGIGQQNQQGPEGGTLTVLGLSAGSLLTGEAVASLAEELLDYQRRGGNVVFQ